MIRTTAVAAAMAYERPSRLDRFETWRPANSPVLVDDAEPDANAVRPFAMSRRILVHSRSAALPVRRTKGGAGGWPGQKCEIAAMKMRSISFGSAAT